jgi:hypothetical protein
MLHRFCRSKLASFVLYLTLTFINYEKNDVFIGETSVVRAAVKYYSHHSSRVRTVRILFFERYVRTVRVRYYCVRCVRIRYVAWF